MAYGINTLKNLAGQASNVMGNGVNAVKQGGQAIYNNPIAGYPLRHPVATTAAVGTAIVAPRVIGLLLPDEAKAAVAQNPVGSALTGLDPNDPYLKEQAYTDAMRNEVERMRKQMIQDQERGIKFQVDTSFEDAKRRAPLEYGWGSAVKFRDTYANQLGNETGAYLQAMANTNDSVRNILAGSDLQFK